MNRIEWVFELFDRVSAPARRISRSLSDVGRAARVASGNSRVAHVMMQSDTLASVRSVSRLFEAIGGLSMHRGFDAVREGAASSAASVRNLAGSVLSLRNLLVGGLVAGGVGVAAKSVVDQVGFVEQQRIALSTLLKSPIRGEATLEWAIKFADVTPFETVDVLQSTRMALAMGFTTKQIEGLLTTLGDVASGTGSRLDDLVMIFGQMRAAGRLATQDINQLAERGVGAWDYLARGLGKSTGEVRKLVEQGAIDSATGIRLITKGMRRDFAGMMRVQSQSIFGLVSTLRSRPQTIAFRLDRSKALEPFRNVLSNLVELTDFSRPPGSKIAQQLETGIGGLFRAAFGPLATATEPQAAMARINTFVVGATTAVERVKRVWPAIRATVSEFVAGVQAGFSVLAGVWQSVQPLLGALGRLTSGFTQADVAAGNVSGFVRLLGVLAALSLAWRVLNIASLGGLGALSRLILLAGRAIIVRLWLSGLPLITAAIQWLGALRVAALRTAGAFVAASARMATAWLVAMGPVGWVIAGITAVGTALGVLYTRSSRFRTAVNAVWASIAAGAKSAWDTVVALFASLPERIVQSVRAAGSAFVDALRNIVRSSPGGDLLLKGLDAAGNVVRGAVQFGANVGNAVVGAAKSALGVRSPSREFAYLGRMSALGLAAGLMAYFPVVERAGLGLAQAAMPQVPQVISGADAYTTSSVPAPTQPARTITINLGAINVHAGPEAQPERIAEAVREAAVEAVLVALERAAMEDGA